MPFTTTPLLRARVIVYFLPASVSIFILRQGHEKLPRVALNLYYNPDGT